MKRNYKLYFLCLGLFFVFFQHISVAWAQEFSIKIDQFGYRPSSQKVAVISSAKEGFNAPSNYVPASELTIIKLDDKSEVYTGSVASWGNGVVHKQSGDMAWWFNFSDFTTPGDYYILDKEHHVTSDVFTISEHVYNHVLKHAVRVFYYQRCGVSKEAQFAGSSWADGACHIHDGQDNLCRSRFGNGDPIDLSGGWHDAGDYNKYTSFTYSVVHQLLWAYQNNPQVFQDNYNIPESGNGIPDLIDEIKFELDFLQKMMLGDGQVLAKVAVTEHQGESPASADKNERYYAPAIGSASRCLSSVFAHAALVFSDFPELKNYSDELLRKSELAWEWIEANPAYSSWDNNGFGSANPEKSEYDQDAYLITAAVHLYLATGKSKYEEHIKANYQKLHCLQWNYWFAYEYDYGRTLLDYCNSPNTDTQICETVRESFRKSMNGEEFYNAVISKKDPYRAYLKDSDYNWGSNSIKSRAGESFYDAYQFGIPNSDSAAYKDVAEDFMHYIHGVNALGLVFMSNMDAYGAVHSANEMYHLWFGDNTPFDNAKTSTYGPPPAYVTGGVNMHYKPDASYTGDDLTPPLGQPVQKMYKDWNTSWPENSWELTEPAIYYQAAYIMLLSKFASPGVVEIDIPDPIVTGLAEEDMGGILSYPVPSSDLVYLDTRSFYLPKVDAIAPDGKIIELKGEEVKIEGQRLEVRLSGLVPGFYILKLTYPNYIQTHRVILK
ncbi:glycoside hydrolase family 9 protein [Flammeovirgaceae bacterium SG7u.111]|nr:glycoside hydrolase family 9 protein [Flammeovirgaceae bacterium SG7u.132]WPO34167.1 glycoside hydrolase family 9 protein [Flammeovirgaceae bacterium SG7u.111]